MEITKKNVVTITTSEKKAYERFSDILEEMEVGDVGMLLESIYYGENSFSDGIAKFNIKYVASPLPCDSGCIYISETEREALKKFWELDGNYFDIEDLNMVLDAFVEGDSNYRDSLCHFKIKYEG